MFGPKYAFEFELNHLKLSIKFLFFITNKFHFCFDNSYIVLNFGYSDIANQDNSRLIFHKNADQRFIETLRNNQKLIK